MEAVLHNSGNGCIAPGSIDCYLQVLVETSISERKVGIFANPTDRIFQYKNT
jgi:hypothetical protein